MNLWQMKYFKTVCEAGTVSAAAEILHIAQPSLSAAIKELESEFGTALFKRTHKGMLPTEEGALFLSLCRDVLERAESAEQRMKALGCNKTSLSLGVPPMIGSLILPAVYRDFVKQSEEIELHILECGREETLKRIREGALDMAFIPFDRFSDPSLCLLELGSLSIVCGASPDDPLERKDFLTPKELSSAPLVTFKEGFFQTHEIKSWFAKGGESPKILMETDQLSTMLSLIESGTAVGCLFEKLIEKENGVRPIPLSPPISVRIGLIFRKNKYFSDGMQRFKNYITKTVLF